MQMILNLWQKNGTLSMIYSSEPNNIPYPSHTLPLFFNFENDFVWTISTLNFGGKTFLKNF